MHLPSETHGAINQRFVAGNPVTGQKPTVCTPELLNAFTYEITNVILEAGIELVKGKEDQLLLAMQALIDQRVKQQVTTAIAAAIPGIIATVLEQVGTGSTGGTATCTQLKNILTQYADIQDGVLIINCPDDGYPPSPSPANGSTAIVENGVLTLNIAGDAVVTDGEITLTDPADSSETYSITGNELTITEA